ncbi:cytoplasmic tRNA 2-thiolation protein 2 [Onygenales sp. PD_12]|nr:cytoplasmic tRNA 2-thiolation protein 2 [Onygenales sp. PD_12]
MVATPVSVCTNCQTEPPAVNARKKHLCKECFMMFIGSKVLRRMDRYRPRNVPKDKQIKLLLPLSFGVSSFTLLHVLDRHLERQAANSLGRRSYNLHVLNVETSAQPDSHRLEQVREAYPLHTYSQVPLHSIFRYDTAIKEVISEYAGLEFIDDDSKSDQERLDNFRSSLSSATSRADIDGILRMRLIVAVAREQECEGILWGDSDSRLASKALAGVAKGRGFSVPWEVCDGMSPWGIQFNFPLRDLFKSELASYASVGLPKSLVDTDSDTPRSMDNMSNKNMSIEDVMSHYVATQGEKYPGVMANIVRTIDKLQASPLSSSGDGSKCLLCGMPVDKSGEEDPATLGGMGTSQYVLEDTDRPPVTSTMCYGCARSRLDLKSPPPLAST